MPAEASLRFGRSRLRQSVPPLSLFMLAIAACAAQAQAEPGVAQLRRGPAAPIAGRQDLGAPSRPTSGARLHFIEPASGQEAPIGGLMMRVAPAAGRATVEVLIAWNSDPRGVTPVETCRVALEQLVGGVLLPPSATEGRTGHFTIQARVVEPYEGAPSAPVEVTLVSPRVADPLLRRSGASPVGDFRCSS